VNTVFQQLTGRGVAAAGSPRSVTQEQYTAWQKQYTFEALKGARYGASFCKHFEIQDYRIYFDSRPESCDCIIRKEWLV
jgi:hypothetical protein